MLQKTMKNTRHNARTLKLSNGKRLNIISSENNQNKGVVLVHRTGSATPNKVFYWHDANQFEKHLRGILRLIGMYVESSDHSIDFTFSLKDADRFTQDFFNYIDLEATIVNKFTEDVDYGNDGSGLDIATKTTYVVKLNMDIDEIPNSYNEDGYLSEQLIDFLFDPLAFYGCRGSTPLSAHSPTGQPFTTLSIHVINDNEIHFVNETKLDC